jgi:hypothetical protein
VVDKALLQSIVHDRLAHKAAAAAAVKQHGGLAHRMASAVRRTLSSSRSSGGGRWEARAQGAQGVRQSDNPRWNDLQATTSV